MEKQKITDSEAADVYAIKTDHEKMPNGELRFRLTAIDGNHYIRTVSGSSGAWQEAHCHAAVRETYIVEKGWMGLAEKLLCGLKIRVYWPKDIVTTEPEISHNVYLPANAVIHTVKHGTEALYDRKEDPKLTEETSSITEKDVLLQGTKERHSDQAADQYFSAYVALYNNIDSLLWRIPGFLAASGAILTGFVGSVLSKDTVPHVPPVLIAGLLLFVGLLFCLSAFSVARIREHHTMAGDWLARMEPKPDGYFHMRQQTVNRKWPPSAPLVFKWVFLLLWILFWIMALLAFFRFSLFVSMLKFTG